LAVQGEVTFARSQQIRVIPLWVDGTNWYDCVSLEMVSYHYLDFRGERYRDASARLTTVLREQNSTVTHRPIAASLPKASVPQGQILVDLSGKNRVSSLPVTHPIADTIFETVDTLYANYLWDLFDSLTYGIKWILASKSRGVQRVVAPLEFLSLRKTLARTRTTDVERLYARWGWQTPEAFGVLDGTQWQVIDLTRQSLPTIGLVTNNQALARLVDELPLASGAASLQAASKLTGFFHVFASQIEDKGNTYTDEAGTIQIVPAQRGSWETYQYKHQYVLCEPTVPYEGHVVIAVTRSDADHPTWV
jgi:hypothetical protein